MAAHPEHAPGERRYTPPEDTPPVVLAIPLMLAVTIVTTVVMAVRIFS
jgi:hypothetical protein